MKMKKIVTVIVSVAVVFGIAAAGIWIYKSYQSKNLVAEVLPVSNINWGYWGDTETSYGMVTNDSAQEIYADSDSVIEEVYVKEGDMVEIGDPLMVYDTTAIEIEIARKKLEINTTENEIAVTQQKLNALKTSTPVDKTPPEIDEQRLAELEALDATNNSISEKSGKKGIYNYLTEDSVPSNAETDEETGEVTYPKGTEEDPYIYYCSEDAFAYGSFYNSIRPTKKKSGKYVEIYVKNKKGEKIVLDGNTLPTAYDEDRMWYIFSGKERFTSNLAEEYMDAFFDQSMDWEEPDGYTQQELAEEIAEAEKSLKDLDIERRRQVLELESLEQSADGGVVYATVAGVVKTVGDKDNPSGDNSAFLVVMGDEGLYVNGTISELLLGDVSEGTVVTANAWESGMTFEAVITEISDFPVEGNSWSEGNPNVSYYSYTAYIEDTTGLKNGEYVDLSIAVDSSTEGGLFIEKAYVREENGRFYCMIADENGKLKKQYVVTGKTVYGSAIEIKSGLTTEDLIAFPYGKEAVEGAAVKQTEEEYY